MRSLFQINKICHTYKTHGILGKRLVPPGYRQRRTSCLEWYNGLEKKVCDHSSQQESRKGGARASF